MKTRRKVLTGLGATTTAILAGCTDMITGDGIEVQAQPAKISDDVITNLAYKHQDTNGYEIDEEFNIADETRTVKASSWITTYTQTLENVGDWHDNQSQVDEDLDEIQATDVAAFTVISTPSEEVLGQEANPVAYLNDDELIEEFSDEIGEGTVESIEATDTIETTVLGEDVEITIFNAKVSVDQDDSDNTYEIKLYVTQVSHEDDILIPAGIHHIDLDEKDQFLEFMDNIEHPVELEETK